MADGQGAERQQWGESGRLNEALLIQKPATSLLNVQVQPGYGKKENTR